MLGLSLVTNLAAGLSGEKLDHLEVLEAGRAAASRMGTLLAAVHRAAVSATVRRAAAEVEAWIADDVDPASTARTARRCSIATTGADG